VYVPRLHAYGSGQLQKGERGTQSTHRVRGTGAKMGAASPPCSRAQKRAMQSLEAREGCWLRRCSCFDAFETKRSICERGIVSQQETRNKRKKHTKDSLIDSHSIERAVARTGKDPLRLPFGAREKEKEATSGPSGGGGCRRV
jgi:hypothetical protein